MAPNNTEQSGAPGGNRNNTSQQSSNGVRGDHSSSSIPETTSTASTFDEEGPFLSSTINNFTGVSDRLEEEFAEAKAEQSRSTRPAPCPTLDSQTFANTSAHTIPPPQAPGLDLNQLSQSDMERLRYLFQPPTGNPPTISSHAPSGSVSQFKRSQQSTSSVNSTAQILASNPRVWKACFAGLCNTWNLLWIFFVHGLPYLIPLLVLLTLATQVLHIACSNGLALVTPLGARLLGIPDFCAISAQNSTTLVLGNDPTGIATAAGWTATSKELMAARRSLADMTFGISSLVALTKIWQSSIVDGQNIHNLTLRYSEAHQNAEVQIEDMFYSHTSFINSIAFDATRLSGNINRMLAKSGSLTCSIFSLWYSLMEWVPRYTPKGRIEHDFLQFIRRQKEDLEPLINKTETLVFSLKDTRAANRDLAATVDAAWKNWAKDCLEQTNGFTGWQSARMTVVYDKMKPQCRMFNHKYMERIMKEDLGEFLAGAREYANKQLKPYISLHTNYREIVEGFERGKFSLTFDTSSLESYQDVFKIMDSTIRDASKSIKVALSDGRFDSRD